MKATLEFNLPDEKQDLEWALKARNMHNVIITFNNELRERIKYEGSDLNEALEMFFDCLKNNGVDI